MDLDIICGIILVVVLLLILWIFYQPTNNMTQIPVVDENTFPFRTFIINLERNPDRYEYVTNQLDNLSMNNYERWPGVDGSQISTIDLIKEGVNSHIAKNSKGMAGCAVSHIRLWKHILSEKLGWTLILEDDAHFHPQFMEIFSHYWNVVPTDAKVVYLGYGGDEIKSQNKDIAVYSANVICMHAYMISWEGAQYLLRNLVPMVGTVDDTLSRYFRNNPGSYIFNGNVSVRGIRPHDYRDEQKSNHGGIVYQNQNEFKSMIVDINNEKN